MDALFISAWILGTILGTVIGRFLFERLEKRILRRRDKRFLRYMRVVFPDAKTIEAISVSTSDKQAMENVERRLRNASRTL